MPSILIIIILIFLIKLSYHHIFVILSSFKDFTCSPAKEVLAVQGVYWQKDEIGGRTNHHCVVIST